MRDANQILAAASREAVQAGMREQAHAEREQVTAIKSQLIEVNTAAFNAAQTYTTVAMFGGYTAFFALWGFTKDYLSKTDVFWSAALIGLSVVCFVLFEVFKMVFHSIQLMRLRPLLVGDMPPAQWLQERKRLATSTDLLTIRFTFPIWILTVVVCVLSGFGGAGVLLTAVVKGLLADPS